MTTTHAQPPLNVYFVADGPDAVVTTTLTAARAVIAPGRYPAHNGSQAGVLEVDTDGAGFTGDGAQYLAAGGPVDRYGRPINPDPPNVHWATRPVGVHIVRMTPHRSILAARTHGASLSWIERGRWESSHVIAVDGVRYGIGYVDDTAISNRGAAAAPMTQVRGRHAYPFGLPGVIDRAGGTAAETADLDRRGMFHRAAVGDLVVIECVDIDPTPDGVPAGMPLETIACRITKRGVGVAADVRLQIVESRS